MESLKHLRRLREAFLGAGASLCGILCKLGKGIPSTHLLRPSDGERLDCTDF